MVDKPLTTLTDVATIDSIDKAKNHLYDGKQLEDAEKEIFEDSKLKNDDNTPKLPEVKNTVILLENLKKAQVKLPDEEKSENNLTKNGNDYLIFLLEERRNNTIAYQVINTKKPEEVSKIVDNYQRIQYKRVNRELELQKREAETALNSISEEGGKIDEEIEKVRKEIKENQTQKEAEDYRDKVRVVVNALKADLAADQPGHKILTKIVEKQKQIAETIYKVNSALTVPSLGSIIKTGVKSPYSDKPFTHPTYLEEGFSEQMRKLFKEFDQNKLFSLIEERFSSDNDKIKKFKKAFERIMKARVAPETKENFPDLFSSGNLDAAPADRAAGDFSMVPFANLPVENNEPHGSSFLIIPKNLDQAHEYVLNLSDILYVMNALFPKDSDYFNNDFLKNGDKTLPFTKGELTTEHVIFWRGREDNTLGGLTYRALRPNAVYPRDEAFPSTKLQLSWGGPKGKSIPEFFWSVYNDPRAITWEGKQILKAVDGTPETVWNGEVSAYENQLNAWKVGSDAEILAMAFKERFERMVDKNESKVPVANRIGVLTSDQRFDLDHYWSDWTETLYDVISAAYENIHTFRVAAEAKSYRDLRDENLLVPWIIENEKSTGVIDNEVAKIWDKMINEVCEGKITAAKNLQAKKTTLMNQRLAINAREAAKSLELNRIITKTNTLKNTKVDQLKDQLTALGSKVDSTNVNSITFQESLAIRTLYWMLEKTLGETLDATYTGYLTNLEALEAKWEGVFGSYHAWKGMGNSFEERFAHWKKNEGKNLSDEAIKAYFELLKHNLKEGSKLRELTPEEKADRDSIIGYLDKTPRIRKDALEIVFKIDADLPEERVEEWANYGDEKKFREETTEIKKIADAVNNLTDKTPFFTELKDYLTDKNVTPAFPDAAADVQDKLNYYFTLSPKHVIGAFATWKIKTDATEKKTIEDEMKAAKDANGIPLSKDKKTGYGDGTKFTDEGIIKYYSEKTGGLKHSYQKQKHDKDDDGSKGKGFWRWDNPAALIAGGCLFVGTALIIAVIVYWEKLAAWWDGPADAEGNGDDDKENDE